MIENARTRSREISRVGWLSPEALSGASSSPAAASRFRRPEVQASGNAAPESEKAATAKRRTCGYCDPWNFGQRWARFLLRLLLSHIDDDTTRLG